MREKADDPVNDKGSFRDSTDIITMLERTGLILTSALPATCIVQVDPFHFFLRISLPRVKHFHQSEKTLLWTGNDSLMTYQLLG